MVNCRIFEVQGSGSAKLAGDNIRPTDLDRCFTSISPDCKVRTFFISLVMVSCSSFTLHRTGAISATTTYSITSPTIDLQRIRNLIGVSISGYVEDSVYLPISTIAQLTIQAISPKIQVLEVSGPDIYSDPNLKFDFRTQCNFSFVPVQLESFQLSALLQIGASGTVSAEILVHVTLFFEN